MVEFVALLRPLRAKLVALLCRPSVEHVAFPLVRTRCFTASPDLGVGASLVEEGEDCSGRQT